MKRIQLYKWLPALLTMAVIFWFSSQPSNELPNFGLMDRIIKKSGHVFEYAVLAFWIWYALGFQTNRRWTVWLIAILYAATDEYHQSFVRGRFPSVWDVMIFDNAGALISLWITQHFTNKNDQTVSPDCPR
ncbi:MAG TPA: VanZ family protein [Anaerolineales bacterium]|nr:VanZ family protein [Anaerolineales bacterium]HNQ93301.1 VanZ family protein [Anaerolineales bacterium]HNS60689.1 VanZ family protein [Anaerolineales bacterium]